MKVITVTNRKGGVGKTTFAAHVAAGLAIKGYRVGMVDAGPQGHLSAAFGRPAIDGLYRVTVDREPFSNYISMLHPEEYSTDKMPSQGALYLLPGSDMTAEITVNLKTNFNPLSVMANVVDEFDGLHALDYIVIDTQPTRTILDESTHMVTDGHLMITELDLWSLEGLGKIMDTLNDLNRYRVRMGMQPSYMLGIVPNKMDTRTALHQMNVASLGTEYGVFKEGGLVLPPCRILTAWREATQVAQKPIYVYAPTSEAAGDAWRVVNAVEERMQAWVANETS